MWKFHVEFIVQECPYSINFSRVKMSRFSDVSGANSGPIFRMFWRFGSTKTDQFLCYQTTSTP